MLNNTTLILSFWLMITANVFCQNYTASYSSEPYTQLTNGILVDESAPTLASDGSEIYNAIPIGFNFNYHNSTFDSLKVGQNGYVIFEENVSTHSFINIFECQQINFQYNPSLSPIYYEVSGIPGDRIFKLEFVNSGFLHDTEENDYISYQLWIYENCNSFEFRFGNKSIELSETDLFYNNAPAPFMGYGKNSPFVFYVLAGSHTAPNLSTSALSSLDSVPNINNVYTFKNCFASINEEPVETFTIYPNPTSSFVNFTVQMQHVDAELVINDLNGKVVFKDVVKDNKYTLNTNILPQGIYVVTLRSDIYMVSKKLIVQ
jgi:hypothetical protein